MLKIESLVRKNVKQLVPYSAAREKYQGEGYIFLDANENPFGKTLNRYPDPYQMELKKKIADVKGVRREQIFIGNGSDEIIDLLIRGFCNPGMDNMIVPEPTYGMYEVAARINDVEVRKPELTENFQPDVDTIFRNADRNSKLVFLCNPNNPTGNLLDQQKIKKILDGFQGLVIIDEAYIDFSGDPGFLPFLDRYPNLIVLQTFSKARAMAGIRLGYAFAIPDIIAILNKIKYPYNVSRITQKLALRKIRKQKQMEQKLNLINKEKDRLIDFLENCTFVEHIFPSDANFFLVRVSDPEKLVAFLAEKRVIIRDRSNLPGCERSVRITIGKPSENNQLMKLCREFEKIK
ncbi:MAG: histidinol-phosphate transaminase [Bacteroidales bacterium]